MKLTQIKWKSPKVFFTMKLTLCTTRTVSLRCSNLICLIQDVEFHIIIQKLDCWFGPHHFQWKRVKKGFFNNQYEQEEQAEMVSKYI